MKKAEKTFLIIMAIAILAMTALSGCGKGAGESAEKRIDFHDLSFVCPEGYVFNEEISDDDALHYRVVDEDGNVLKTIYLGFDQMDAPANLLDRKNAEDFCEGVAGGENVHDYEGYEIVDYNDELSALEFTLKFDANENTYNCTGNAFCDDSGGVYTLMVGSLGDDSLDDLNAVVNSMKYTFDVFPDSGAEADADDGSGDGSGKSGEGSGDGSGESDEGSDGSGDGSEGENKTSGKDESEVSPEFKEMMDSYEDFFDEYVEFMKKYQNSSNTAAMLTDYADYMTKYADYMQKLNALDEDEMTVAEAAYYTEVNARIMKKLAEVA